MTSSPRIVVAILVAGSLMGSSAFSQDKPPTDNPQANNSRTATGGLRAYLDPATGKLIEQAPDGISALALTETELYMFSDDDFGLIERVMPDGGLMIDLQGRFREGTVASIDKDQRIRFRRVGGQIFKSQSGTNIRHQMRNFLLDSDPNVGRHD